ncbi:hypothetical protein IFM89_017800 [Coptis chinensis]|uniref:RRM domain-containing protein n=1 Tax=Coptis chinensis TaxID=261450 RepID=A0A835H3Q2_9MAGN|nr:hypothetical protein IFM89_017800 [Coptis chinensis]
MSSTSQPQFRYTQTPSKVLHLRNLPWECIEEELVELCKPFGKIVNTKCNVGANRNQAFVEFVDQNQAISMVSYYASSSEPAQVRGKTVYIQYSNRQEIVNNKSSGDVAGNVLLVTIEGVEAGDVSIDVIHLVFSAFGFVHKIATFEKAAGFQALIQFTDAETAASARNALDGRSIPRLVWYLLPEHVSCNLRISYSAHTDLNIKFQSHRSRDYTNPYLPVNPSAIEGTMQPTLGPDGKRKEPESNVLLASIENLQYAVTVDVLHTVFSAFGTVQKIAIFDKNGGMQALVQYPESFCTWSRGSSNPSMSRLHRRPKQFKFELMWFEEVLLLPKMNEWSYGFEVEGKAGFVFWKMPNELKSRLQDYLVSPIICPSTLIIAPGKSEACLDVTIAAVAKEALEGHCIYDGGYCKLHLSYSRHTDLNVKAHNDRSRDYTIPEGMLPMQQAAAPPTSGWQSPQAASGYPGNNYAVGMQGQVPEGQSAPWDPSTQAGRQSFVSVPTTFPGQTFAQPTGPAYHGAGTFPGSAPLHPPGQGPTGVSSSSHSMPQYAPQSNYRPAGTPPAGQSPYYGQ